MVWELAKYLVDLRLLLRTIQASGFFKTHQPAMRIKSSANSAKNPPAPWVESPIACQRLAAAQAASAPLKLPPSGLRARLGGLGLMGWGGSQNMEPPPPKKKKGVEGKPGNKP